MATSCPCFRTGSAREFDQLDLGGGGDSGRGFRGVGGNGFGCDDGSGFGRNGLWLGRSGGGCCARRNGRGGLGGGIGGCLARRRGQFLFELAHGGEDGGGIGGRRLEREVFLILLQRHRTVLQILLFHNRQVQEGRRVIGLLLQGRIKALDRFIGPTAS